jgi:hypothetical protein
MSRTLEPRLAVSYTWKVAADVEAPLAPGVYRLRIVEGGTYRNLASRRKYTVVEVDPEAEQITYEYTRAAGETVSRTGAPTELAVVEAVGDTPPAIEAPAEVDRE